MKKKSRAQLVAQMGLMMSLAAALSLLEGMIPPIAGLPPGIKPGLSNTVVMYALYAQGKKEAFLLAVLKAFFALLTRGPTAGLMSLSGGLVSVGAMSLLTLLPEGGPSAPVVSICGAVFHNIGQLLAAYSLLKAGFAVFYYLPVMIGSGIVMGLLTAAVLKVYQMGRGN